MDSSLQLHRVSFRREEHQAYNLGRFICPGCDRPLFLQGAYWPGIPNLETTLRGHFDACPATNEMPNPVLFVVNESNGYLAPGLVVIDRRIPTREYAARADRAETETDMYMRVARVAGFAARSRKQPFQVLSQPFDIDAAGIPLCFKFADGTSFTIIEQLGDTAESLTLKAFRRMFRPVARRKS